VAQACLKGWSTRLLLQWRPGTVEGTGSMVEVNQSVAGWRRGSACLPGECVEVAAVDGYVLIHDSADKAAGPILAFSGDQWQAFTEALRSVKAQPGKRGENLIPGDCRCPVRMRAA